MRKISTISLMLGVRSLVAALLLLVFGLLLAHFLIPESVSAQSSSVTDGINATTRDDISAAEAERDVNNLVASIVDIFSWVVGVIAVIMIIVGGLKYITAAGDSNSVSSAKNTILYAIVGLVVVAFAQIIVIFALNEVNNTAVPAADQDEESTMVQSIIV